MAEFKEKVNYDKKNKRHKLGDSDIENKLLTKMDQLLVWLVNGSVKYYKNGLANMPETVMKATNEYLDENDDIKNLLKDNCNKNIDGFVYHKDLYQLYVGTYKNVSQKVFTSLMKTKGYISIRYRGQRGFKGLELKEDNADFSD